METILSALSLILASIALIWNRRPGPRGLDGPPGAVGVMGEPGKDCACKCCKVS